MISSLKIFFLISFIITNNYLFSQDNIITKNNISSELESIITSKSGYGSVGILINYNRTLLNTYYFDNQGQFKIEGQIGLGCNFLYNIWDGADVNRFQPDLKVGIKLLVGSPIFLFYSGIGVNLSTWYLPLLNIDIGFRISPPKNRIFYFISGSICQNIGDYYFGNDYFESMREFHSRKYGGTINIGIGYNF